MSIKATDLQPGQKLDVEVCTPEFSIAKHTIWYNPNDWLHPDDLPERANRCR